MTFIFGLKVHGMLRPRDMSLKFGPLINLGCGEK